MSNNNEVFTELINNIIEATGKTEAEIAIAVKRNSGYISQLKSRMKQGGEAPATFIELLKLHFASDLNIQTKDQKINMLIDEAINLQASVNILLKTVENISATQKGMEVSLVSGQMRQAIKIEYDRLHEEFAKKQKF